MKINRVELIAKLNTMIAEAEENALACKTRDADKAGQAESDYVNRTREGWAKFADVIRVRLRRGQAITINDVPRILTDRYGTIQVFKPTQLNTSDYVPRTLQMTRLVAVLESSPDEFVTDSSLSRMGVPLRDLMRP